MKTATAQPSALIASLIEIRRAPLDSLSSRRVQNVVSRIVRAEASANTIDVATFSSSI